MSIVTVFSDLKDLIEGVSHLQRDALHVHIGLAIFLGVAAMLKSPGRFRIALLSLLGFTLLGEAFDLANNVSGIYAVNLLSSLKDIVNTMFWPTVLVVAGPPFARLLGLFPTDERPALAEAAAAGGERVADGIDGRLRRDDHDVRDAHGGPGAGQAPAR